MILNTLVITFLAISHNRGRLILVLINNIYYAIYAQIIIFIILSISIIKSIYRHFKIIKVNNMVFVLQNVL